MAKNVKINLKRYIPQSKIVETSSFDFMYDCDTKFQDLASYLKVSDLPLVIKTKNEVEGTMYYYGHFDYIYSDDEIIWDENIYNVKILDYLKTFNCKSIDIEILNGGIGDASFFMNIDQIVDSITTCLKELLVFCDAIEKLSLLAALIIEIKRYIKRRKPKYIDQKSYFFSILLNRNWKLKDFMKKYELDEKNANALLQLLGYKYDAKKKMYCITKQSRNIILKTIVPLEIECANKAVMQIK